MLVFDIKEHNHRAAALCTRGLAQNIHLEKGGGEREAAH